jgi:uncharacterized RDD family membrane protein YckC
MQTCAWCRTIQKAPGRYCENCGAVLVAAEPDAESDSATAAGTYAALEPPRQVISAVGYGGFWIRAAALFIDGLVLIIPIAIVRNVFGSPLGTVAVLVGEWLYFAILESSSWQATLGKKTLGLAVVNADGTRLTFGRACVRYVAKIVSGITLCIGYMMAGWTSQKRALHDMIAETLVVKRAAARAAQPIVFTDAG